MFRALAWIAGGVLLLVVAAVVALRTPAVQDALMERAIQRAVASQPGTLFDEGALRVLVCGSSSPLPHPTRARPCLAVFAGDRFFVVDVGTGSWNNLALWRIPGDRIGAVLLTHFHSDHIGELGEYDLQTWAAGRPDPLRVFGPRGVDRVVAGFEEAYALDAGYRTAHHGAELMNPEVGRMQAVPVEVGPRGTPPVQFFDEDGLRITAFAVDHRPVEPSIGYRFEYGGRSVVVTGDTARSEAVIDAARGADVLVHEAQSNAIVDRLRRAAAAADRPGLAKILGDIPDYHTTPVEAAEVANAAGVGLLVLTHLTPPPPNRFAERIFLRGVAEVRPRDWLLADDGVLVELPEGTSEVDVRRLESSL